MDKFALVYEFNKESPLAAYIASNEIELKNFSKAIKLLESVIEKFPHYPTPYFLMALAQAYENNVDLAKEYLFKGDNLLNNSKTKEYYENKIDRIIQEAAGIHLNFEDTVNDLLDESFIEPENYLESSDLQLIDEDFEEAEPNSFNNNQQSIITETLAEIYASQDNYDEALDIYEQLIELKPDQKIKFENRILEIKQIIENKKNKKFGK